MDGRHFDTITQGLTAGIARRRAVGGLLGGALALLTGTSVLEAKKGGKGKGKGRGKRKGKGKGNGKGNGKGKQNGKAKVWLCHQPDPETGEGTVLQVSAAAKGGRNRKNKLRGHLRHGDVECPVVEGAEYVSGGACTVTDGVAECEEVVPPEDKA